MALLDRLLPAWRNSDPDVRAAAVREMGKESLQTLAAIARGDTDARVRRIAVKKLEDPELLAEIGRSDADEDLRALATARAEDLLVDAAVGPRPAEECLRALAALSKVGQRIAVATRAAHPEVRRAALAGLSDERAVAEVARKGDDPQVGLEALARVADTALLHRIAVGDAPNDVALAALKRIQDPAVLLDIAEDQHAHKGVRKQARALLTPLVGDDHPLRLAERRERRLHLCAAVERLGDTIEPQEALAALAEAEREWQQLSTHPGADPLLEERFRHAAAAAREAAARVELLTADERRREAARLEIQASRRQLCETVEALQGSDTPARLAEARAAWEALGPFSDLRGRDLAARFAQAVERCEQRHDRWQLRQGFHSQLESLVADAERLVAANDPRAAVRPRAALEKRWTQLETSPAGTRWMADERTLKQRFVEAGEALVQQEQALRAEAQKREREARGALKSLCHQLEQLLQGESVSRSAADRALNASADIADLLRAVPADERDDLRHRITTARQTLAERADETSRAEDWKRWANAEVQQKLIDRAEELLAAGDPRQMLRELGKLEQEWKRFAVAPRDQSQALWDRFRKARDDLRRRGNAYLAENLTKKEALCAAAEQLADSTDWNVTAAAIRRLQEEWKEVGPVRQQLSDAVYERFRGAANRFFERQKEALQARREHRDELLGRMRALCDAAEALTGSTDWETAAAEIKKLQLQSREVWRGPRRPAARKAERRPAEVTAAKADAEAAAATEAAAASPPEAETTAEPKAAAAAGHEKPRPGDLLRNRFDAACDRFFDRYRRRDDLELQAKLTGLESVLAALDNLREELAGAEAPNAEQVAQRVTERLAEWGHVGAIPPTLANELAGRLQAGLEAIEAACPEAFAGDAFDGLGSVAQREKLCARLEKLVAGLPAAAADPAANDLGARLKLALAAKTIGGAALSPAEQKQREAREAAERLVEKWQRLGPILGGRARELAERFEKSRAEFQAHHAGQAGSSEARRRA